MRETPKSLRAYFILVGLVSILSSLATLTTQFEVLVADKLFMLLVVLLSVILGAAYLYLGANLPTLLRDKPQVPVKFAGLAIGLSAMGFSMMGVLVNFYIFYQLKRMAKEAAPEVEEQVLD